MRVLFLIPENLSTILCLFLSGKRDGYKIPPAIDSGDAHGSSCCYRCFLEVGFGVEWISRVEHLTADNAILRRGGVLSKLYKLGCVPRIIDDASNRCPARDAQRLRSDKRKGF